MGKVSKETNVCDFSIEIFLCSSIFGPSFHKPSINHCQCVKMTIPQPGLQHSTQFGSVTQSRPTLCDPMDCSTSGFPVHHQILELANTHVHWDGNAIQPSHPLSSPSPPAFNPSQHQGLFKWVSSLHQVAKVLELQHWSFQWIFRTDSLVLNQFWWTSWIFLQSKGLSRVFSNTTVQKHQFFSFLYGPVLTAINDYWGKKP